MQRFPSKLRLLAQEHKLNTDPRHLSTRIRTILRSTVNKKSCDEKRKTFPWNRRGLKERRVGDGRLWTVACIRLLVCVCGAGHTAELRLVNEARLIRIRTLINSPAEFSSSPRRLASGPTAYPSFPFSTEGRMVLALRILRRRLH